MQQIIILLGLDFPSSRSFKQLIQEIEMKSLFKKFMVAVWISSIIFIIPGGLAAGPNLINTVVKGLDKKGMSDCFWIGPVSINNFNIAYPDVGAIYWLTRYRNLPEGSTLIVKGKYPHARYISFHSYNKTAMPIDSITDIQIEPDLGSVNPFSPGMRRDTTNRSYTLYLKNSPYPKRSIQITPNTLYLGGNQNAHPNNLIYRLYLNDKGTDLTGNAGLPEVGLLMPDGKVLKGQQMCQKIGSPKVGSNQRFITTPLFPKQIYLKLRDYKGASPQHPARYPLFWRKFIHAKHTIVPFLPPAKASALLVKTRNIEYMGGYFSNIDNAYIVTEIDTGFGDIIVLKGKLPKTPRTLDSNPIMEDSELRYWSLCENESTVTTQVVSCVYDEEVQLDKERRYTIVISKKNKRPKNSTKTCGITWLDWGENGDGVGKKSAGKLIMRNMKAHPNFRSSIQSVPYIGDEAAIMKKYLPEATYMTKQEFEKRGCRPN